MRECFFMQGGPSSENRICNISIRDRSSDPRKTLHCPKLEGNLQKIDSILQEAFPSHPIQNELDKLKEDATQIDG